jgi:hypothetical protein
MDGILTAVAVIGVLCLQGWMLALILKLRMDVEKFGRLVRKLRRADRAARAPAPDPNLATRESLPFRGLR